MRLCQVRCCNKDNSLHPYTVALDTVIWFWLQECTQFPTTFQQIYSIPSKMILPLNSLNLNHGKL